MNEPSPPEADANPYVEQFDEQEKYDGFVDRDPMRNFLHYPAILRELALVGMEGERTEKPDLERLRGRKILDVGSGAGHLVKILLEKGALAAGYDKAGKLLAKARKRVAELLQGQDIFQEAEPTTFEAREEFDDAVSVMVLCYSPDEQYLPAFFTSTYRALRPGGRFILVTFNPDFRDFSNQIGNRVFTKMSDERVEVSFLDPETGALAFPSHLHQFSKKQYEQSAKDAGFRNIEWKELSPTQEGKDKYPEAFWDAVKDAKPYSLLVVTK